MDVGTFRHTLVRKDYHCRPVGADDRCSGGGGKPHLHACYLKQCARRYIANVIYINPPLFSDVSFISFNCPFYR